MKLANKQGLPTILDSSGQSLMDVLLSENKPSVIKPNIDELSRYWTLLSLQISIV